MPVKAPVFLSVSVTTLVLGGMVLSRNLSTLPAVESLARRAGPIASPAVLPFGSEAFTTLTRTGSRPPQSSFDTLADWEEGTVVNLPLPDGSVRPSTTQLVRREDGFIRAGGSLADGGSFAFGSNGVQTGGLVQLPAEGVAWQLKTLADGTSQYVRRRLEDVRCGLLPRPVPEREEPLPSDDELRAAPPILSSRPGASAVLFLDFDGDIVTDPNWADGQRIDAPRARLNSRQITMVHERVAGDYASFAIDITTDPSRYANAAVGNRMRCIVTRNDKAAPRAGGVAYVGSFAEAGTADFTNNIPCWVFIDRNVDSCAEAISHELGHTLGLSHDGRDFPGGRHQEYYPGQGRGKTGWAPIMGVSYYKRLSQWSKGEYKFPSNIEDDIAIISGATNGFGFVPDEAGNTTGTAANLNRAGPIVDQRAVIRNASDLDVFRFVTSGGRAAIRAVGEGHESNADLLLELLDSGGNVIKDSNRRNSLSGQFLKNLASGTYYLRVRGVGKGNPLRTGYSEYGSIGAYKVVGKINGLSAVPLAGGTE